MHVNAKMIPVETSRNGGGGMKETGEFKYDIFVSVNATVYPHLAQ
jgi:hypothetical protein